MQEKLTFLKILQSNLQIYFLNRFFENESKIEEMQEIERNTFELLKLRKKVLTN